jgi:hypothetical protein
MGHILGLTLDLGRLANLRRAAPVGHLTRTSPFLDRCSHLRRQSLAARSQGRKGSGFHASTHPTAVTLKALGVAWVEQSETHELWKMEPASNGHEHGK